MKIWHNIILLCLFVFFIGCAPEVNTENSVIESQEENVDDVTLPGDGEVDPEVNTEDSVIESQEENIGDINQSGDGEVEPEVNTEDSVTESQKENIADIILPGYWEVEGETVIFHFDSRGIPVAISNYADPQDWKTNIEFGTPRRIEAPIGMLDIVFLPEEPYVSSTSGETTFAAYGTGTNIHFLFIPIPGEGSATFEFSGFYDDQTGELNGTIHYAVYYGPIHIISDELEYTLHKLP